MCDATTSRIAHALRAPFKSLGSALSKDYGGTMKNLWIDLELIESRAKPRPFRFQKKVGGSSPDKLTGLPREVHENVGHYSVCPDFEKLRQLPQDSVVSYVLGVVYVSTSVLLDKRKKLGGLDAERFRADFVTACEQLGHAVIAENGPG